jgi:hypothetical protein
MNFSVAIADPWLMRDAQDWPERRATLWFCHEPSYCLPLESRGYFPMRTAYLPVDGATQWCLCVNDTDVDLLTDFKVKRGNSL